MAKKDFAFLYHGTDIRNVPSMKEKGIQARKQHPDKDYSDDDPRVFLTNRRVAKDIARHSGKNGAIVRTKIPKADVNEHPDPEFSWSKWTDRDISPKEITKVTPVRAKPLPSERRPEESMNQYKTRIRSDGPR